MPTWDPRQYLKFADHRLRPALDLLAQIPLAQPSVIYDLGCGPGTITRLLAERWPGARITGVDTSAAMLAKARQEAPGIALVEADIGTWSAPAPADLLYSNATLQWLGDHPVLLPRLFAQLAPGGVLAGQMPHNHDAPSHALMRAAAQDGPWRTRLAAVRRGNPVLPAAEYYAMLAPLARQVDIWETEYLHVLEGDDPVVEWVRGTGLRPYLEALDEPERTGFLADYRSRIAGAYPRRPDGRTLLPFRRLFFVACR